MAAEADAADEATFTGDDGGSMGQHKWLNEGNGMRSAPQNTTQGITYCLCWLGCVNMLTPQDIEIGDDLCTHCRKRHAKGALDCCECECQGCSVMAARFKVLSKKAVDAALFKDQQQQFDGSPAECEAGNQQCWVTDPETGITEVCEENEYNASYRNNPRKKSRAWYASHKKDVVGAREATEPNIKVDTREADKPKAGVDAREANTSRSGNVNVNGKGYVNRTGNMHVNITIPEVPRHFKTRRQTRLPDGPTMSLDSGANRVVSNNTASGKGSGKGRQPRTTRGKGSVESF